MVVEKKKKKNFITNKYMVVNWKHKERIKKIFKWSGKIIEPLMFGVL